MTDAVAARDRAVCALGRAALAAGALAVLRAADRRFLHPRLRMPYSTYWLMYRPRRDALARRPSRAGDIVMLGDSITHLGKWDEHFPGLPVRNFGISGDTTDGVLARLEPVTAGAPRKVFLLIGTNDVFLRARPPTEIAATAGAILEHLRAAAPGAEVFVQSVMPRQRRYAPHLRALNDLLVDVATVRGAAWIDLWPALDDGTGRLARTLTVDGLHPNRRGHRVWADQIRPLVEG